MSAPTKPVCCECGSDQILIDAYAAWDEEEQNWVLHNTFDEYFCEGDCGGECSVDWVEIEPQPAAPDLLESCRAMVAAFGGDVPDWLQHEVAQMEAAIAKATAT